MSKKEGMAKADSVLNIRKMIEQGRERLRSDHAAIAERLSLGLDFEHYNQKDGTQTPSRILPRDPGMFDVVRYKAALTIKRAPISIRCRQVEDDAGDYGAEAVDEMRDSLEDWITDPRNRMKDTRRRYIWGAYAAGAWAAWQDYDPERRTAVIRPLDPRNVILPEGILDPHDPECEWVIILDRVPTARVRRMKRWTGASKATPDAGYEDAGAQQSDLMPGQVDLNAAGEESFDSGAMTTVAYCYRRNSDKKKAVQGQGTVEPGEERMLCSDCYWTSPPQREMMGEFPIADACPMCGGLATLTDKPLEHAPMYPDGLLTICAPLSKGNTVPFYEGDWPIKWPTFPLLWLTFYTYPHRLLPQSDVSIHKTGVLASNAIIRLWYEQALTSKPRFRIPRVGLTNSRGEPYTFSPADGDVMYDESNMPGRVELIQGQPMNTSLTALYDRLQGRFRENQGTSQISLDPQQSKDIAVGTVKTLTETGNVPLDDHIDALYTAESPFLSCLAETLRTAYNPARKIRKVGPDGRDSFVAVSGATMPRVLVEVSAGPSLDSFDAQKVQAFQQLVQTPPQYRKALAKYANIPPEIVQTIQEAEAEAQANAMNNAAMGAANGVPGMVPGASMGVQGA